MDLVIRDYRPTDYQAIALLWVNLGLGGAVRGDNQQIVESSIAMGGKLLVAETPGGQLIGTSWMTFDGRRIHLHHFGISPEFQRRGFGNTLALASIEFARQKGFQIKLEVHQTNLAAINMYKKLGFEYLGDYDVYIIRSY